MMPRSYFLAATSRKIWNKTFIFRPTRVQHFSGGLGSSWSRWVPGAQSHIVGSEPGSMRPSATSFLLFMAPFSPLFSAEDGSSETTADSRLSDRGSNPEVGPAISLLASQASQASQNSTNQKSKLNFKEIKTQPKKNQNLKNKT